MKFLYTLLFNCLIFSLFGQSQILKDSRPISFKIPNVEAFYADSTLESLLQSSLEQSIMQLEMTGASVAVNFPNGEVWTGVVGKHTADINIKPEHTFAIGSVSKTIISATILKLVEMEKLSLDDTIGQWIIHENIDPTITIRQCLNHTSGIYNYTTNPNLEDSLFTDSNYLFNPLEVLNQYVLKPDFKKGTSFKYSNTNYLIAGLIIENVTEKPCHEAVRTLILDPNGFENVQLFPQETLNLEMAHLWLENDEGIIEDFQATGNTLKPIFSFAWSAGAYTATPSDMALWIKKLVNGEILNEQSMTAMKDYESNGYGLGLIEIKFPEGKVTGHGGEIFYGSEVYLLQPFNTSFAVHTNDGTENGDKVGIVLNNLLITYLEYLATTSNNDLNQKFDLSLFPNPASESIHVKMDIQNSDFKVEIYNLQGKFISNYNFHNCNEFEIRVTQFQNGGYFLHILGNDFSNTQFFIKNNE